MVRQLQGKYYKKHYSSTVLDRKTDFAALAKSFGADGIAVSSEDELESALKKAFTEKMPYVIDCRIDKDEEVSYMIPSEDISGK